MALNTQHFRNLLNTETLSLNNLCENWCQELTNAHIPEDANGQILTTIGQTKLLMNQRFKQFNGLIDDCEFKRGVRETKIEDLLGFWEMIYFQVEDIYNKFKYLDLLKANEWLCPQQQNDCDKSNKVSAKDQTCKTANNNDCVKQTVNIANQSVRKALARKN